MQLRAPSRAALLPLALAPWLVVALCGDARADEASGTWTGAVQARGNYYWETSTRVVAPEVGLELESPDGVRLHGTYLVDTITSASQAAGVRVDIRFTEIRHDFGGGAGYELDLGDAQLDLRLDGHYSTEPDYESVGGSVGAALSLAERSTVLNLGLAVTHDTVGKKLRGANRVGADGRDLSDRGTVGTLDGVVLTASWDQLLGPTLTLQVGYDLGIVRGYQSNPYRMVNVDGALLDERHPDERARHTAHGRLAWYHRPTGTAFHALYRAYLDDWDVAALTPEVRVYQHIGEDVMLRARYRYYTQTRAFFQRGGYSAEDAHWTADPKMAAFHSHLLGGLLLTRLRFLEDSALDFAWNATLELGLEYVWNTNSYGDGIIGQVGLRLPF